MAASRGPASSPLKSRACKGSTDVEELIAPCGPQFAKLAKHCLDGIKTIFKTTKPVIIYTATGTGAWEAALVNTLSQGDRVLMVETGQFASLWRQMATRLGLDIEFVTGDWRH